MFLMLHKMQLKEILQTKSQQMLKINEIGFFSLNNQIKKKYLPPTVFVFH
jgi:hypothetical protein